MATTMVPLTMLICSRKKLLAKKNQVKPQKSTKVSSGTKFSAVTAKFIHTQNKKASLKSYAITRHNPGRSQGVKKFVAH